MERILEKQTIAKSLWEITTTVSDEQTARENRSSMVDSKLAACVQIVGPIRSIYRWQDAVHDDQEWKCVVEDSFCRGRLVHREDTNVTLRDTGDYGEPDRQRVFRNTKPGGKASGAWIGGE